jgi:DNA-binding transcriptional MerR regulator
MVGMTVRALHHYDEIGLLRPARGCDNDYRIYGEQDLLRLQQILLHRELGLSLHEIGVILDDADFDRLAALKEQRRRLAAEAVRYRKLVRMIDRTIESIQGDRTMKHSELYCGFVPPEKQAEYEEWLVDRRGDSMRTRIEESHQVAARADPEEHKARMAELAEIENGLAKLMQDGLPPESRALDRAIERHRDWVATMWGRPCPTEAYGGLADVYLDHPDFVARYETIAAGFGKWLPAAMKAWARRQEI